MSLAGMLDSTNLRGDATSADIERLCADAAKWGFAAVCINPWYVPLAASVLRGSGSLVASVAGFPLGASTIAVKAYEAEYAARDGATEIDMVVNLGALKSGDWQAVEGDIRTVADRAADAGASVKVILECCLLTDEEKRRAAEIAIECGAAFLKTSTGLARAGATTEDVRLLSAISAGRCGVKAAGGIRDLAAANAMVAAGATRIGTSAAAAIAAALLASEPQASADCMANEELR